MNDPLLVTRLCLDGVIATVDAATGEATLDRHGEAVKQAAVADGLRLTKTDLADETARTALAIRLAAFNPAAALYDIVNGVIDPGCLMGAGPYDPRSQTLDVQRWLKAEAYGNSDVHATHSHDVNHRDDRSRAFAMTRDAPLDWDRFNARIEMLIACYGADILRLKGIVNVEDMDRPLVIHGVQHLFHPPALLDAWPDAERRSRLSSSPAV
jgi:G3E family GTPase